VNPQENTSGEYMKSSVERGESSVERGESSVERGESSVERGESSGEYIRRIHDILSIMRILSIF
jgi:hypothetical protein